MNRPNDKVSIHICRWNRPIRRHTVLAQLSAPDWAGALGGAIQDANRIEIVSNVRDNSTGGPRFMTDEYAFSVYRARAKVGSQVLWVNNGRMTHTVMAEDGSWTTGPLAPLEAGALRFDKPGTYTYICKDHPWAKAQLIVEP